MSTGRWCAGNQLGAMSSCGFLLRNRMLTSAGSLAAYAVSMYPNVARADGIATIRQPWPDAGYAKRARRGG